MKVLFICSGNMGPDPISRRQGNSLQKNGVEVAFYDLIGKGFFGYLANIPKLRKYIKSFEPNILHAHYSMSGFVATLTLLRIPKVVSLMGSDVLAAGVFMRLILKIFMLTWQGIIVKSEEIYSRLGENRVHIIPNGVDFDLFYPIEKAEACERLNWSKQKVHILFASNPIRPEKNFKLAQKAMLNLELGKLDFELHYLHNLQMNDMIYFYNAADILLLTSFYEGSPNVIKEAMACNCPIVTTFVGDVEYIIGNTKGCYIASDYDIESIAQLIINGLENVNRTNGSDRIDELKLDVKNIASKLISIYNKV